MTRYISKDRLMRLFFYCCSSTVDTGGKRIDEVKVDVQRAGMHYLENGLLFPITEKRLERFGEGNDE